MYFTKLNFGLKDFFEDSKWKEKALQGAKIIQLKKHARIN